MITIELTRLTDREILEILKGTTCVSCGKRKKAMRSHCPGCYWKLAQESRNALYRGFHDGYEEAFVASLNELGVEASASSCLC